MIEVVNIIAGLVLCVGILEAVPAMGKHLKKLAMWIGGFQTIIGIIAIILALWIWLDGGSEIIQIAMAIIAGLILIVGILPAIPAMGKHLAKLAKWLGSFDTIIGIIAIIVGIWGLL
jgi:zinc transporter ZupT